MSGILGRGGYSPQRPQRPQRKISRRWILPTVWILSCCSIARAQEPSAPQPVSAAQLQAAIGKLGDLNYTVRTDASRMVRRSPAGQAVPALTEAVTNHAVGYVRYRALVLLTGFNDPSPNDRVRTVAYRFFERTPDAALAAQLLAALDKETAEFVRPALIRALAAQSSDPKVRQALLREVGRGED